MSLIKFLQNNRFSRKAIYLLGTIVLQNVYNRVKIYFRKGDKILDIGAGTCNLDEILRKDNFSVVPLDVVNISFVDGLEPLIYDGEHLPFKNKQFDLAIIFYVLHHTRAPEKILLEAKRVARRILIREEVYQNSFQKYLTFLEDSLLNFEFVGHPHANKDDAGWRQTFRRLGFKLLAAKLEPHLLLFTKGTYLLASSRL